MPHPQNIAVEGTWDRSGDTSVFEVRAHDAPDGAMHIYAIEPVLCHPSDAKSGWRYAGSRQRRSPARCYVVSHEGPPWSGDGYGRVRTIGEDGRPLVRRAAARGPFFGTRRAAAEAAAEHWRQYVMKGRPRGNPSRKSKPGEGSGRWFKRCVAAVSRRGGARDPRAICATVAARKVGRKKLQKLAATGRRRKARQNPTGVSGRVVRLEQRVGRMEAVERRHGRALAALEKLRKVARTFGGKQ